MYTYVLRVSATLKCIKIPRKLSSRWPTSMSANFRQRAFIFALPCYFQFCRKREIASDKKIPSFRWNYLERKHLDTLFIRSSLRTSTSVYFPSYNYSVMKLLNSKISSGRISHSYTTWNTVKLSLLFFLKNSKAILQDEFSDFLVNITSYCS